MTKQIEWEIFIQSLKEKIVYYENLCNEQPHINSWHDRNACLSHLLSAIEKGLKSQKEIDHRGLMKKLNTI